MDKWRTSIQVDRAPVSIGHTDNSIFLGSCFSVNIAGKFDMYGLRAQNNPLGIIYNPVSISKQLRLLLDIEELEDNRFIQRQNHYFHLDAHSDFNAPSKEALKDQWTAQKHSFQELWAKANFLFITLGTSWIYDHKKTKDTVANCHKIPSKEFEKRLLTIEEIKTSLLEIINLCNESATPKTVVFTVSPVRHIKDGLSNNALSKARLLSTIHELINNEDILYFPSFEIMMDDLRDYRYYEDDMIHPTAKAIKYIWDIFKDTFFDEKTQEIGREIEKMKQMKMHRPMFPKSEEYEKFKANLAQRIDNFKSKYPELSDFNI